MAAPHRPPTPPPTHISSTQRGAAAENHLTASRSPCRRTPPAPQSSTIVLPVSLLSALIDLGDWGVGGWGGAQQAEGGARSQTRVFAFVHYEFL